MARDRGLSVTGLARLAGTTPERIRDLTAIGVLIPADGRYAKPDIQRVQVAAAYERGGIPLKHVALAIREGRMSFEFTDRIYPEASPPSGRTLGHLVAELGASGERLPDVLLALGLARATPDRPLSQADEATLRAFVTAWTTPTLASDALVRAARIIGDATRRAAWGSVDLFLEAIGLPPDRSATMSIEELRPRMFEPAIEVSGVLEPTLLWAFRQHLVQRLNAANVGTMEEALALDGIRPRADRPPPAIVFADLSGYTRLTEEIGDAGALHHAEQLAHLASDIAVRHGGHLVKQLGDGVMLAFAAPLAAAEAAAALRDAAAGTDLPPLHVGISAGPVIERDGDYYGRTVILASRLSGAAGPGEIVLDGTAAAAIDARLTAAIGATALKGIAHPVELYRLVEREA